LNLQNGTYQTLSVNDTFAILDAHGNVVVDLILVGFTSHFSTPLYGAILERKYEGFLSCNGTSLYEASAC
jgi:hypothetical protein